MVQWLRSANEGDVGTIPSSGRFLMLRSNYAHKLQPPRPWGPRFATGGAAAVRSRSTETKSSPHSLKARSQQQKPGAVINQ